MTVSNICARALSLANLTGSSLFSSTEKTDALNAAYRDVYEKICDANDDYFVTEWTWALSAMTAVTNDPGAYKILLPTTVSPFYRLRKLEYQSGTSWRPVSKFSLQDEYQRSSGPQYRLQGLYLLITFPPSGSFTNFRAWYYPTPSVYDYSTFPSIDITVPPQLEVDLLAYQIAVDMKRKQGADYAQLMQRRDELWALFLDGISNRDNWDVQAVANVYRTTSGAT